MQTAHPTFPVERRSCEMDTAAEKRSEEIDEAAPRLLLRVRPALEVTEDQFFALCQLNCDLRIERTAKGEWVIMPPTGGGTGRRNADITIQLGLWAKRDGTGVTFDSSTGFRLPDGAVLSPDAAWMPATRLAQIRPEDYEKFIPACPDFVLELRSPSDRLSDVQDKMAAYLANGARLGWLVDPVRRRVYVYRPDAPMERLEHPDTVSGEPVLPGFVLDLRSVW